MQDTLPDEELVAITGMAFRFPGASDRDSLWANLSNSVDSIRRFSEEELVEAGLSPELVANPDYVRARGTIDGPEEFAAEFFGYSQREAETMDPQQRLFLECCAHALEDGGYQWSPRAPRVGVFAGTAANTYLMAHDGADVVGEGMDSYEALIGNDKDFLATRAAYKLGLVGPAVSIQTACSTGLAAVHYASQSVLLGECEMALVGAVALQIPAVQGYLYEPGSIFSPSGRCRPFAAGADGSVLGNGVGVVVVRRLDLAKENRETIYAVIRGSAINNDGGHKMGFTAPSARGQAAAILDALTVAQVAPSQVRYVEAHGSGTALGDPIEVAALKRVFKPEKMAGARCALGSIKSNIGHMGVASGIAGLIKTALVLQRREIPPSAYFDEPNPEIEFDGSSLYVNTEPVQLPETDGPSIAGVSSFGLGGTNVHVVLQSPPVRETAPSSRPFELLMVSAKKPDQADEMVDRLGNALKDMPSGSLLDAAHTLAVGRNHYQFRRAFVAATTRDAASGLSGKRRKRLLSGQARDRSVAFLFPGFGELDVPVARELYGAYRPFREAFDSCVRTAEGLGVGSLRDAISAATAPETGGEAPASLEAKEGDFAFALDWQEDVDLEALHPALFALEYALSRLWLAWGLEPSAVCGYSLGEYVAATIAGVLSLEDALEIVVGRARLAAALPRAGMLAVSADLGEVEPLLQEGARVVGIVSDRHVLVGGDIAGLTGLTRTLTERELAFRSVSTGRPFHSPAMDAIEEQLHGLFDGVHLEQATIPIVSSLTGRMASDDEMATADYWIRQGRSPVRFRDAVDVLLRQSINAFLEVGPGQTLGAAVFQQSMSSPDGRPLIVASLGTQRPPGDQSRRLLESAARLWVSGVEFDWAKFYEHDHGGRIPLPTYPFPRKHFSLARSSSGPRSAPAAASENPSARRPVDDWYHVPVWRETLSGLPHLDSAEDVDERWLVFSDPSGVADRLAEMVAAAGHGVVFIMRAGTFERTGRGFSMNTESHEHMVRLFEQLEADGRLPDRIVFGPTVGLTNDQAIGAFFSTLHLAQVLAEQVDHEVRIAVLTQALYRVTGRESVVACGAVVEGLSRVAGSEIDGVRCTHLDLPPPSEIDTQDAARWVIEELRRTPTAEPIAYRDQRRWLRSFEAASLPDLRAGRRIREGGSYLVSGGFGGLGLAFARRLVEAHGCRVALIGRKGAPTSGDNGLLEQLAVLRKQPDDVLELCGDIAQPGVAESAFAACIEEFGAIHGVIHAAGSPGVGIAQLKEADQARDVLAPKVTGADNLVRLGIAHELDFVALFSSTAALLGGAGQFDYCAANAYMDALAHESRGESGCTRVVSIDWAAWQWDAWAQAHANSPDALREILMNRRQAYGIPFDEGFQAFERILDAAWPQVVASPQHLGALAEFQRSLSEMAGLPSGSGHGPRVLYARPDLETPYEAPRTDLEKRVTLIWADIFGTERLGIDDDFFELGGHSLLAARLLLKLRSEFSAPLPLQSLLKNPTIRHTAVMISGADAEETSE